MLARKVVAAARGVAHECPALETPGAHYFKEWPPSSASMIRCQWLAQARNASLLDIEHDAASIMTLVVRLPWLRSMGLCEARGLRRMPLTGGSGRSRPTTIGRRPGVR